MPSLIHCPSCGSLARVGMCPHCGALIGSSPTPHRAALVLGLVLGLAPACGSNAQAEYGVAITDNDGDGYLADVDCDDDDATVYPDAEETPGDGVDSNCDGEDDT